ncbi:tetratricopeptide repeat protein [bacterium]|nr:tetratricopeptide repeat protein [bacterium]
MPNVSAHRRAIVTLLFAAIFTTPFATLLTGTAWASDAYLLDLYTGAVKLEHEGQTIEAAHRLDQILLDYADADDPLLESVLFRSAQIHGRELGDFDGARARYEQLIERYPNGRYARRAKVALAALADADSGNADVSREYQSILRHYQDDPDGALSKMRALIDAHPQFAERAAAWMFVGDQHLRRDEFDQSVAAYEQALLGDRLSDADRVRALTAIGDALVEKRDLDAAEAAYRRLEALAKTNRYARTPAETGLARVRDLRVLRRIFQGGLVVVFLYTAVLLIGIPWRKVTWPMAMGVWPEALTLSFIALGVLSGLHDKGPIFVNSVTYLWIGGVFLMGCNNLYIQTRPISKYSLLVFAPLVLVVVLAMCFAVYHSTDLANLLWDSLRYEMQYGALKS